MLSIYSCTVHQGLDCVSAIISINFHACTLDPINQLPGMLLLSYSDATALGLFIVPRVMLAGCPYGNLNQVWAKVPRLPSCAAYTLFDEQPCCARRAWSCCTHVGFAAWPYKAGTSHCTGCRSSRLSSSRLATFKHQCLHGHKDPEPEHCIVLMMV